MNNRLNTEKKIFEKMVFIYCKNKHKDNPPCIDCREVIKYGHDKINSCIHGVEKPFCSKCTVHCYEKNMKKKGKRYNEIFRSQNILLPSNYKSKTFFQFLILDLYFI